MIEPERKKIKVGDKVECIHDVFWQNKRRSIDGRKAKDLDQTFFMGNASAYLHLDEAYVVEEITHNGGLRLRGFAALVSQRDVRRSDKEVFR